MLQSSLSLPTIISWIISSGLILFFVNFIYDEFLQTPLIGSEITEVFSNQTHSITNLNVFNAGSLFPSNINNISLTILANYGIIKYSTLYYDENINNMKLVKDKDKFGIDKLHIVIPRLSYGGKGATFEIIFDKSFKDFSSKIQPSNYTFLSFLYPDLKINAVTTESYSSKEYIFDDTIKEVVSANPFIQGQQGFIYLSLIIVIPILIILFILLPFILNRIKNHYEIKKLRTALIKDAIKIKTIIGRSDTCNTMLISPLVNLFYKKGYNFKKLFHTYDEYNIIKDFFSKIIQRDQVFSKYKEGDIAKINHDLLSSCNNILSNINWQDYIKTKTKLDNLRLIVIFSFLFYSLFFIVFELIIFTSIAEIPYESITSFYEEKSSTHAIALFSIILLLTPVLFLFKYSIIFFISKIWIKYYLLNRVNTFASAQYMERFPTFANRTLIVICLFVSFPLFFLSNFITENEVYDFDVSNSEVFKQIILLLKYVYDNMIILSIVIYTIFTFVIHFIINILIKQKIVIF